MPETLVGLEPSRLARSCRSDAIRLGATAPGVEFAAARFTGAAFEPHRHDTYAVGLTTGGVQQFHYRGARHVCGPGQFHVLHPDVVHDGGPATDAGFAYRIVYVEPSMIGAALGGRLPFVAEPVVSASPVTEPLARLLEDIDDPIDDVRRATVISSLADALSSLAGGTVESGAIDRPAMEAVRERLAGEPWAPVPAAELERISGLDRFSLARQFRRAYGTSPDRYRTMRRLEMARWLIAAGTPLAAAAAEAGFTDQSHLTRQFKRAFGLTPGRFAECSRNLKTAAR
jgi:AraC-like DNA-binding protein